MKVFGLTLIFLAGFLFSGEFVHATESAATEKVIKALPYDSKGLPLSVTAAEEQKKREQQKAKAKQVVDEVLGPAPAAARAPDLENDETSSHRTQE